MSIFGSVLLEVSIVVGYCVVAGIIGAMLWFLWDWIKRKIKD